MTTKEDVPVVMPMNVTLGEFLNRHLEVSKDTLKKRTWENHDDTVRVHLIPMLGHLKLKELRPEHIQYLYTAKRAEGLSPGTVRRIHAVLSSALSRESFSTLVFLETKGVKDAEDIARETSSIFDDYPHWKESTDQEREIRLALYKALRGSEPKRMVGLVNELLTLLKRASQ